MKKLTAIVLFATLMLSLTSCGEQTEPSPSASTEPPVSAAPSDIPSAEPSAEPSEVPSVAPADDIDAYWEGRTLTTDGSELSVAAGRWVRDYYKTNVDEAYGWYWTPELCAARITNLSNKRLTLYTEYRIPNTEENAAFHDEYTVEDASYNYLMWRKAYFTFVETEGGYKYEGISSSEPTMSLVEVRASGDNVYTSDKTWLSEAVVAALANGERLDRDSAPMYADFVGDFAYAYGEVEYYDEMSHWTFYTYTDPLSYTVQNKRTVAICRENGEIIDCGEAYRLFADLPASWEVGEGIADVISDILFLDLQWGGFYIEPEDCAEISEKLRALHENKPVRVSTNRDSMYGTETLNLITRANKTCRLDLLEDTNEIRVSGFDDSGRTVVISDVAELIDAINNTIAGRLDTLRDGTSLTEYERWDTPAKHVPELDLLREASNLIWPFDGSNTIGYYADTDHLNKIAYHGAVYIDHTEFYDPNADDWTAHISSYAEFEAYVRTIFCKELADRCLEHGWNQAYYAEDCPPFIEGPDGKLYGSFSERGGDNPAVGNALALYRFQPKKDILVLRIIYDHHDIVNGDCGEIIGETAFDTVFVREDGRWKLLGGTQIVD